MPASFLYKLNFLIISSGKIFSNFIFDLAALNFLKLLLKLFKPCTTRPSPQSWQQAHLSLLFFIFLQESNKYWSTPFFFKDGGRFLLNQY